MVMIPLGYAEGDASVENLARIRLRNMYVTENRYSPDKLARLSRPTLSPAMVFPESQSIFGVFSQEGTLDGLWLVVVGEKLYKVDPATLVPTYIDALPGTDIVLFAGTRDRVLMVRNEVAYSTDGVIVTEVVMPDDRPVGSVATIDGYFLLGQKDAQRFYWIAPGETDPDGLSFASAERTPDPIVAIAVLSDEVWFLGGSGTEVWQTTGDADSPFQRIAGRVYSDGCVSAASVCTTSYNGIPALLWVTEKRGVMVAQGSPQRISTKSTEDHFQSAENFRAWTFRHNLHDFYCVSTDLITLVLDITNGTWAQWDTYGKTYWRAHLGIQVQDVVYAADYDSGTIWTLEDGYDDDGTLIVREVSGFVTNTGKGQNCSSVNVRMNAGWPPSYTDDPVLEMRFSDDYGFSWSNYIQANIGQKGKYEYDVTWRSLGQFTRPGREFEFRFTSRARYRLDYATMNEV